VTEPIKVLLAEGHTLVSKGIRSLLEKSSQIEVLAEAKSGVEVLQKAQEHHSDVVLMDVCIKPMDGLMTTRVLQEQLPDVKVLILAIHDNQAYLDRAIAAGASGYLVEQTNGAELIEAVKAVHAGNRLVFPDPAKLNPAPTDAVLSLREREVLKLLARGKSIQESAKCLKISPKTIESHRTNLMKKLDIHTIAELTQYAIRIGLIDLDD